MQDLVKNNKWRGMAMKRDNFVARSPRSDTETHRNERAKEDLAKPTD